MTNISLVLSVRATFPLNQPTVPDVYLSILSRLDDFCL